MKKFLRVVITILFFFIIWQKSEAATALQEYYLNIDKITAARGYTVEYPDENFKIGFVTNTFINETTLKIVNLGQENFTMPDNFKLVSDIYLYDFSATPKKLLNLALTHNSYSAQTKKIYFWDNNYKTWRELPSTINGNKTIGAVSPFKFAKVAILEKKVTNDLELKNLITAKSAIVMNAKTGEVLFEKNSQVKRPIASLTKIMTAMIFLEHNPGWDQEVEFLQEDDAMPAKINLDSGDTLKISDLFYSMLVKSANNAAKAIARLTNLNPQYFIWLMNLRAQELGLAQTTFVDPTGLDAGNISTAYDYAILAKNALTISDIPRATTAATYSFKTLKNNKQINLENTTKLFGSDLTITMTKTGYTYEAGNCLMTVAKNLQTGKELIAVALGSKPGYLSTDVYTLLDYYLNK